MNPYHWPPQGQLPLNMYNNGQSPYMQGGGVPLPSYQTPQTPYFQANFPPMPGLLPAGFPPGFLPPPGWPPQIVQDGPQPTVSFSEFKDPNGRSYWHNPATGETTWICPNAASKPEPALHPTSVFESVVQSDIPPTAEQSKSTQQSAYVHKTVLFQAAGSNTTPTGTSLSSSGVSSMKSLEQSEEEDWVRQAEMHFNAIAPPQVLTSVDKSILAMEAHTKDAEEAEFMEEMLAAKASLELRDSFVDPIPAAHKERLKRALARNMEYVLLKDTGELQRHIDRAEPKKLFGMDGSRKKRKGVTSVQGSGGLGSADAPQGPAHSGKGAGGAQQARSSINSGPNTAVYVSCLPETVTWTVLDMLFSAYGRVRRIKIYRDTAGVPKGDALVTYVKPISVELAIGKLNGFSMSEGKLKVEPATFSETGGHNDTDKVTQPTDESLREQPSGVIYDDSDFDAEGVPLYRPLPLECKAALLPTCVLRNVYTANDVENENFMTELEAEFLVECVKFGTVVCLTTFPESSYYLGSIIVTFDQVDAAQSCAQVMDGRSFAEQFIQVQALGNWGEGEINPNQTRSTPKESEGGEAKQKDEAGGGEELDDFFSSVLGEDAEI